MSIVRDKITSYSSGMLAELIAVIFLSFKFYRVIGRRYKTKLGEIDIIAVKGGTVVFIEVKKRKNKQDLFDSITIRQQKRVCNAAEIYLANNYYYANYKKRFDAILIAPNLFPIHIKNAW